MAITFAESLAGSALVLSIIAVGLGVVALTRWASYAPRTRWLAFIPCLATVWLILAFFMWSTSQTSVK